MIDAVLLNGTVGAGKSTTAEAVGALLAERNVSHAVIDVDAVRLLWPSPPGDPFQLSVMLANLRDLARNYRAAGAERLVLAGVVEHAADLIALRYALQPRSLLAVRLTVDPALAAERLGRRHAEDARSWALDWHLRRSPELAAVLESAAIDDEVIAVGTLSPQSLAGRVAALAGW